MKAVKQNSPWLISQLQSSAKTAPANALQPVCFYRATCSASDVAWAVSSAKIPAFLTHTHMPAHTHTANENTHTHTDTDTRVVD